VSSTSNPNLVSTTSPTVVGPASAPVANLAAPSSQADAAPAAQAGAPPASSQTSATPLAAVLTSGSNAVSQSNGAVSQPANESQVKTRPRKTIQRRSSR
jgi:hypothetical protein